MGPKPVQLNRGDGEMSETSAGVLEVGCNEQGEVVINHPDLKPDADGVGHIVFSPDQARNLAKLLTKHAGSVATVSMQNLLDAGLNAFGLQLFVESIANKKEAKDFKPLSFVFRGIRITLEPEPGEDVDTRHH
jgi:hypothetical protein